MQKQLTLTKEQAAEFYKEHTGKDYFDSLCTHMSRFGLATCVMGRGEGWEGRLDLCVDMKEWLITPLEGGRGR